MATFGGANLYNAFFESVYGQGVDLGSLTGHYVGLASGAVASGNPPYSLSDFAAIYPKFFGPPISVEGNTVAPIVTRAAIEQNSNVITVDSAAGITVGFAIAGTGIPDNTNVQNINGNALTLSNPATTYGTVTVAFSDPTNYNKITGITSTAGVEAGLLITGNGIPGGTLVASVGPDNLTLSQPVTATNTDATFSTYPAPFVPLLVIQMYINLAQSSLMQARWFDAWPLAMALYVAHYVTLWMQTETGPNSTAAQVATSGLQQGIIVSQAAGDVSASTQPLAGFDDWGSMALTAYGVQLATMAKAVGSGPIYVGSGVGRANRYF